jgi:alpha-amylase
VNRTLQGEGRAVQYFFAEVIDPGNEAIGERDYYGLGYGSGGATDITEFTFTGVGDKFTQRGGPNGPAGGQFSAQAWGMMPGDKAVVFLENHDTQRYQNGISYRDGQTFRLANVWMLAQPYGYPSIMSSYAFERGTPLGREMGPPSNGGYQTRPVNCAASFETVTLGDWVCEHRDPYIRAMVGFRRDVGNAPITRWYDNGSNAIAFSRGNRGFVAINRETSDVALDVVTDVPAGVYCDLLSECARSITVGADGNVRLTLASNSAIAIVTDIN